MSDKKKPRGYALEGGRYINVYLDQKTIEKARHIGQGNVSLGIRKLFDEEYRWSGDEQENI